MNCWDTAGNEDYDRLRPLSYPRTHVMVLCFSLADSASLQSVRTKWQPEAMHYVPGVRFVLAGLKADVRSPSVSSAEAEALAVEVGARAYVECSAATNEGVEALFEEIVRAAYAPELKKKQKVKPVVRLAKPVTSRNVASEKSKKTVKCMVLGDAEVGKTALLKKVTV